MFRLLGPAIVSGLLLFGCAASDNQKLSDQTQVDNRPCATTNTAQLKFRMQEQGVNLTADIEGEVLNGIQEFVRPHVLRIPTADRALIFTEGAASIIVWFRNDCGVSPITAVPTAAIVKFLQGDL